MTDRQGHIPSLDIVRGLAALAVVVGHARMLLLPPFRFADAHWQDWAPQLLFANHGSAAVIVFFVISGFLVGGAALREREKGSGAEWMRFIARRFIRLAVVLWPALALTVTLDAVSRVQLAGLEEPAAGLSAGVPFGAQPWVAVAGNALLLQGVLVENCGSNSALWTLSWEWASYAAFCGMMAATSAGHPLRRVVAFGILAAVLAVMGPRWCLYFVAWCVGAYVAKVRMSGSNPPLPFRLTVPLLVFAVFMDRPLARAGCDALQIAVLSVATGAFLWAAPSCGTGRAPTRMERLGRISYSLYASHTPLLALIAVCLAPTRLRADPVGWILVALATLACVLLGACLWRLFESRTDEVRRLLVER